MYKTLTLCGLAFALLSFNSCKTDKKTDEDDGPAAGMVRLSLNQYGLPATIDIPDTDKKIHGVETLPTGDLHVFVGNGFHISINVTDETMERKKNDIAGDDVDKFQSWAVQDSNAILYKTLMAQEEYHFYAIVKNEGHTYYVKDLKQGINGDVFVFNQPQVQAMLQAAKTIKYAATAPKKDPS